MILIWNAKQSI